MPPVVPFGAQVQAIAKHEPTTFVTKWVDSFKNDRGEGMVYLQSTRVYHFVYYTIAGGTYEVLGCVSPWVVLG